jgi:hypothetical protein
MSDGTIRKADKDYTKEVDKQLPEAETLSNVYDPRLLPLLSNLCPLEQRYSCYRETSST